MRYNSSEDRKTTMCYGHAIHMPNCPHVLYNHSRLLSKHLACQSALVSGSTWQRTVATLHLSTKLTPFSRLISAFFCPLLARPLCSRAAFKSATRSEWSGFPSNVTSSSSAILLHSSARTSGVVHERACASPLADLRKTNTGWCIFRSGRHFVKSDIYNACTGNKENDSALQTNTIIQWRDLNVLRRLLQWSSSLMSVYTNITDTAIEKTTHNVWVL